MFPNLDNKKNSEDSDCEIGCKEHVEPKVEDVIDNHSQYWWLIPYSKSVQNSNVLKEDQKLHELKTEHLFTVALLVTFIDKTNSMLR